MQTKLKVLRMSCPARESWFALAAGVTQGEAAQSLLLHASGCSACSQVLKDAIDALQGLDGDSATPDLSDPLPSEVKRALADRMAERYRPKHKSVRWIALAAAVILGVASASAWIWHQRSAPPLAQLARAYTANRLMDLRVPGAAYASLSTQRGALNNLSPDLLEAQARIQRHGAALQDPQWLYAAGRAAVLSRQFDDAIQDFTAAGDLGENGTDFWIDSATAYYERGLSRNSPLDFTKAVECLSRALDQDPANPAALFNRGIVYGRLFLFDPAIRDLEKCISIEKDQGWSHEARTRLEELRGQRSSLFNPTGSLVESQFETALQTGLQDSGGILHPLAEKLIRGYRDAWLTDALNLPFTPVNTRALRILASVEQARWTMRPDSYIPLKDDIAWLLRARLAKPLDIWARFEVLFRDSHTVDLSQCNAGRDLIHAADRAGYQWFAIQSRLEGSGCLQGRADLNAAEQMVQEAIAKARASGFDIASIRAQGFLSADFTSQGRHLEAFDIANSALAQIVGRGLPLRRAHQFYTNMMLSSESLQEWNTASASQLMAVAVAEKSGWLAPQIWGFCELGDFANKLGRASEAAAHYRQALSLVANLPRSSPAYAYYDFARVGMLQAARDEAGLRQLASEIPAGVHNAFVEAPLWNALSEVTLDNGRPDLARDYARRAIAAADPHASTSPSRDPDLASRLSYRHQSEVASGHLVHSEIDQHHYQDALIVWQQYVSRDSELTGGCRRSANLAPLDPGVVAITIAPIDERLAIWTRTSASLTFRWASATPEDYLRDIRKLRRLAMTAATTNTDISRAAKTIASVLFQDLPPYTVIHKLRIQARGEFAGFPLQIVSAARPGPTVEDAAFVPLPGVCSGVCQAGKPGGTVIAASRIDPRFERILPSLGDLEAETRDVASHLPGTTLFSGAAATPTMITNRAALTGNFHFSGHALRWQHAIGLVMSPDQASSDPDARAGIWTLRPGTPFCANLAFFSACSSGAYEETGTILPGDLAEAALGAGASRVIVALWDVDSQATREFVSRFYDNLNKGATAEVASYAAARSIKAQQTNAHPYFWAPFVVFESATPGG